MFFATLAHAQFGVHLCLSQLEMARRDMFASPPPDRIRVNPYSPPFRPSQETAVVEVEPQPEMPQQAKPCGAVDKLFKFFNNAMSPEFLDRAEKTDRWCDMRSMKAIRTNEILLL